MQIQCPPGYFADRPPISAQPFWYFGKNIRFRDGAPETLGLFSQLLDDSGHARVILDDEVGDFYTDEDIVMVGSGLTLNVIVPGSPLITIAAPAAGAEGRWWFTSTEKSIICGRTNLDGITYSIDRATLAITAVPNAPVGAMGGGIVQGILILAGATGVAGDGPKLVVRWSARRTDASSGGAGGPFGFEDWTPSDVNASGEFLLDEGSQIVGGFATPYGFMVWTDTRTYLMEPRPDQYVFTLRKIAQRGLMSPKAFGEADGRIWWWDASHTLNVYDGGGVQQIPNPIRSATIGCLCQSSSLLKSAVSVHPEYSEVILHYPDPRYGMVELVFNYADQAWYWFSLDRVALTDAQGLRSSIGLTSDGYLYFYDLRERPAYDILWPPFGTPVPWPGTPKVPEPFDWYLMTNHVSMASQVMQSMRSRNIFVAHAVAEVDPALTAVDEISLTVRSFGSLDLRDDGITDSKTSVLGTSEFPMRAGGKRLQFCLHATDFRSQVRFGVFDVPSDDGGVR